MKRISAFLVFSLVAFLSTAGISGRAAITCTTDEITESDIARQPINTPPTKNWVLYTRQSGAGGFVTGPGTPPAGVGSLSLQTPGVPPNASDKVFLFNFDHAGTPLSSINNISYSTYRTAGAGQQVTALNIQIDINGGTLNSGEFATLVFEPVYNTAQGPVQNNTWQAWDAYGGGTARWWGTGAVGAAGCDATEPLCTWTEILSIFPHATIVGGFGVNQGGGNDGLFASTDALTLGYGGSCFTYDFEPDTDGDGVGDGRDNCLTTPNPNQEDADNDGIGDACDSCPGDPQNDLDGDGVCGNVDNCPTTVNADQADADGDNIGDACDPCPNTVGTSCPVPANRDQCKNGGWMNLFRANGTSFKNQGQCIQYVNTGK